MSARYLLSRPLYALSGVAVLDLAARFVPDLLLSGKVLVIPVPVLLASKLVVDAASLGWFLSWGLLGAAVFITAPWVFPQQVQEWAHGVPARAVVALGSVVTGICFSVLAGQQSGASQVIPPWWTLPATFVAVFVFVPVTRALPPLGSGLSGGRTDSFELDRRASGGQLAGRVVLIVFLAGTLLALVSQLFPLPEMLLLLFTAKEFIVDPTDGGSDRKDVAERFLIGLSVVWRGPKGVLGLLYAAFPTVFVLWFSLTALRPLADPLAIESNSRAVAFVALTLGGATFGTVVASVRLIERLSKSFYTEYVDAGGRLSEEFEELNPRVPGFMFVPGVLLALYVLVAPKSVVATRYSLSVAPLELGVAAVLVATMLATVFWAELFPAFELREYHVAVASATVFLTVSFVGAGLAGIGIEESSQVQSEVSTPVGAGLVFGYFVMALTVAPFAGFELFDTRGTEAGRSAKSSYHRIKSEAGTSLKWYIIAFVLYGIAAAVGRVLLSELGYGSRPVFYLRVVLVTATLPFFFGFVYRLLLMPFYFFERLY